MGLETIRLIYFKNKMAGKGYINKINSVEIITSVQGLWICNECPSPDLAQAYLTVECVVPAVKLWQIVKTSCEQAILVKPVWLCKQSV